MIKAEDILKKTDGGLRIILDLYPQARAALIIRKTKCSGISEQNVPFPKRNVPL